MCLAVRCRMDDRSHPRSPRAMPLSARPVRLASAALAALALCSASWAAACSEIGEGPRCTSDGCSNSTCVGSSCDPPPGCEDDDCPPPCEGTDCPDGGCIAKTCADVDDACGEVGDGCGGTLLCDQDCPVVGTWYVGGPNASDDNPGTASEPFATIQRAADVAVAGEVVRIRSGVYRETVIPQSSGAASEPIVFRPDGEAQVTVSGADPVSEAWSVYQGDIYQATIALPNTGYRDHIEDNDTLLANQLFVDGKMMIEARWPNLPGSDHLFDRDTFRDGASASWNGGGDTTLSDPGIPDIAGGWTGGVVWANGWFISQTKTITGHAGGQVQFSGSIDAKFRKYYYLTGRLGALDAEQEWFYDGSKLYLWAPGGGSPSGVEVKARNWAFDLRDRAHITVRGIAIFAASVISNDGSTGTTLDGLAAKYLDHSVTLPGPDLTYSHAGETGIRVMGAGSIIQNSVVEQTSDHGIVVGSGATARNNLVHDISYSGTYASGISPAFDSSGVKILYNTIYRTGRSAIDMPPAQDVEIGFNELYDYGLLNTDLGAIYGARNVNLSGTRIHHNWIHDNKAPATSDGIQTGIYFDQAAGPCTVDHNVLWNNVVADLYNQLENGEITNGPSFIYNNTFATQTGESHSYVTYTNAPVDVQRNNIYRDDIVLNWGQTAGDVSSALLEGTDPLFVGSGAGGLAYRIAAGSPAVDAGIEIPGITDGFLQAAPDIGAYEAGGEEWVAGYGTDPQQ
jgi:hypothetical protein